MIDQNLDNVRNIYPLNRPKIFTHEEALELMPLLQIISAKSKRQINALNSQLSFQKSDSEKAKVLQQNINRELQLWSDKVRRLGTLPISLCKVKIPSEEGYFLWEYPENKLYLN